MLKLNKTERPQLVALALALRLLRDLRRASLLPSPLLSLLLTAALLVDKAGHFSAKELQTAQGIGGWQVRASVLELEERGLIAKLAGRQYFKSQNWHLTAEGITLTRNALTRLRGLTGALE